jgi:hypothetical protein
MAPAGLGVLTVHAAQGTISRDHEDFIRTSLAALDPDLEVRIRHHSPRDLYAPDNLESFAKLFEHDHIVADPTGAFTRVSNLSKLARLIRARLAGSIEQILWKAEASALVVVTSSVAGGDTELPEGLDRLRDQVKSLVDNHVCPDLKRAIRSVQLFDEAPPGRHTPVDSASCPKPTDGARAVPARRRLHSGILARISGIAALIGLGALSAANASTAASPEDARSLMPGITGLVGLTTLGENSYGVRNRYQAVGGLRLYFGDTGLLMLSAVRSGTMSIDDLPEQREMAWPKPSRRFAESG